MCLFNDPPKYNLLALLLFILPLYFPIVVQVHILLPSLPSDSGSEMAIVAGVPKVAVFTIFFKFLFSSVQEWFSNTSCLRLGYKIACTHLEVCQVEHLVLVRFS